MSSARSTRALRGTVAAAFSTFVALFSHVAAGGAMPGAIGVLVPLAFSTMMCVLLVGRQLSLLRLSLSVAVSQLLFHTLFVLGAAQGAAPTSTANSHLAHGAPLSLDVSSAPMAHTGHTGAEMWAAHAVAALVTVAMLYYAETLVSTIAAIKGFVLKRLILVTRELVPAPVRQPRVLFQSDVNLPLPLAVYPKTTALRGPPVQLFL